MWGTLLSLQHEGVETCAVISAPELGRRWWASLGGGAYSNNAPLRVSAISRLQDASVSFSDVRDFARLGWGDGFARLSDLCLRMRGFGDFWSHMLVAEGAIDCGIEARGGLLAGIELATNPCLAYEAVHPLAHLGSRR